LVTLRYLLLLLLLETLRYLHGNVEILLLLLLEREGRGFGGKGGSKENERTRESAEVCLYREFVCIK
jgi:hypothetical protein